MGGPRQAAACADLVLPIGVGRGDDRGIELRSGLSTLARFCPVGRPRRLTQRCERWTRAAFTWWTMAYNRDGRGGAVPVQGAIAGSSRRSRPDWTYAVFDLGGTERGVAIDDDRRPATSQPQVDGGKRRAEPPLRADCRDRPVCPTRPSGLVRSKEECQAP